MRARWKTLHRTVYVAIGLTVIHFQLIEKKDWTEALPYLLPLAALYIIRLAKAARDLRPRPAR
jgi:DMSO/TMAO reductase YedYZ heme-binding membrane subunit